MLSLKLKTKNTFNVIALMHTIGLKKQMNLTRYIHKQTCLSMVLDSSWPGSSKGLIGSAKGLVGERGVRAAVGGYEAGHRAINDRTVENTVDLVAEVNVSNMCRLKSWQCPRQYTIVLRNFIS